MPQFGHPPPQNFVWETKTATAFRWSVEELFAHSKAVYLWTYTVVEVMPSWCMGPTWARFQNWMINTYEPIQGVRIFEWHTNHGLHVHMLVNRRLPVTEVRRYASQLGFGRMNVKRCHSVGAAKYLAKYLGKDRGKIPHGGRAWARFGGLGSPVSSVQIISPENTQRMLRAKAYRAAGMKPLEALERAKADARISFEIEAMRSYRLVVPNPF